MYLPQPRRSNRAISLHSINPRVEAPPHRSFRLARLCPRVTIIRPFPSLLSHLSTRSISVSPVQIPVAQRLRSAARPVVTKFLSSRSPILHPGRLSHGTPSSARSTRNCVTIGSREGERHHRGDKLQTEKPELSKSSKLARNPERPSASSRSNSREQGKQRGKGTITGSRRST